MKEIIAQWIEARVYQFPDDAPVHDKSLLIEWVYKHPQAKGNMEFFAVKNESRDFEIVD